MHSQFAPNEQSVNDEKKTSLAILSRLDGSSGVGKKSRRDAPSTGDGGVLNVRKAIRFASGGRGPGALGRAPARKGAKTGERRKGGKGK